MAIGYTTRICTTSHGYSWEARLDGKMLDWGYLSTREEAQRAADTAVARHQHRNAPCVPLGEDHLLISAVAIRSAAMETCLRNAPFARLVDYGWGL